MFFKNFRVLRVQSEKTITTASLIETLSKTAMPPAMKTDAQVMGWVSPRDKGPLVESVGNQFLIALGYEKKLLPSSVINQFAKIKGQEISDQQGFKAGRKQMKDIKEQVIDELMPRAFMIASKTLVWIDLAHGWLVINSASTNRQDDVLKSILKSIHGLKIDGFKVNQAPMSAMTQWLQEGDAPSGFTIDSNTELRSQGDGAGKVRFVNETIDTEDIKHHLASGKQCTSLALTWSDKLSFVLTENLTIKKINQIGVLKEPAQALNDDERFDAEFTLMTGELHGFLVDLVEILGGFTEELKAA